MGSRHRFADVKALNRCLLRSLRRPTAGQGSVKAGIRKIPTVSPHSRVLVLLDESNAGRSVGAWLLDRVDDVGTDLFVALQL
jgi:hypothetical protein